ncbi:MAG TPA: thioredoxin domain-containing protein [Patescibacteria group bacterium]|nr:thioredoxin domain-containing protein [Patescibacteria group bacterium]
MTKRFALIIAIFILGFAGFLIFVKKDAKAPSNNSVVKPTSHTFGQGKTGVTLVEYGDFQCPACYSFEPVILQVRSKYQEQITFQFRNFPLFQIHKNALVAARAAEAASLQGKFWEMHDKLYENQDPTGKTGWVVASDPASFFVTFAGQLGLDTSKFSADLKSSYTNDLVQADLSEGQKLSLSSTPSFILDGNKLEDPRNTIEWFSGVIDDAIKAKTGR